MTERERERERERRRGKEREWKKKVKSVGLKTKNGIIESYSPALVNAMKCLQSWNRLLELELELEPEPDSAFSMLSEKSS